MTLNKLAFALLSVLTITWLTAQSTPSAFDQSVKPFLEQNCLKCHNVDNSTAGVRVDQLSPSIEDQHVRLWESIRHRVEEGSMPPKGLPQPTAEDRHRIVTWINQSLEAARARPAPKNGIVRRLTVAQYRNTLRDLLKLDDDLTEILPPDAISADGFVNNKETLQLSPLLLETYLEIAEKSLQLALVDPKSKPKIQNFRVELGESINSKPLPEELILGANSHLLENADFVVSEPALSKPFPFLPSPMRTNYKFIEGYAGNDTVRGWREYTSIYHSVFACIRGSGGYPKGQAYSTIPQGLLLRPAIPNEEMFGTDGTYGPKANFKISLRELPDQGRFRVTVTAAKYQDGLLLDPATPAQTAGLTATGNTVNIPQPGVYQVDVHTAVPSTKTATPDSTRLSESLVGSWPLDGKLDAARLEGKAHFVKAPFGQAVSFGGALDAVVIPPQPSFHVGTGDLTVSAWINPRQIRKSGIITTAGWKLEISEDRGGLRFESFGPLGKSNGATATPAGIIRQNAWQHVTAVVNHAKNQIRLYVNGYPVARAPIGPANLDNPNANLTLGHQFRGDLAHVNFYRRALTESEIQALLEVGREFVKPPPEKSPELTLAIAGRHFSGTLKQPAFLVLRLPAGPLTLRSELSGVADLDRIVFTPLPASHELSARFLAFEKRAPSLGVHLGLRRDCGSTFAPVGPPQTVSSDKLSRFVFEGAIRNFPSPDVEKDNVNYLAGVREIAARSEFTDGRDMPRLLIRSVEFEGPFYDTWPPVSHSNIFSSSDPRQIIRSFASRAYRRPLSASEETALMAVYTKSFSTTANFQQSIKDVLQVVLTSPQFLFLIENSATPAPEPVDSYELASKLSYFLWNAPPDRSTLQLAAHGTLRNRLDSEVDRLIADPRFAQFSREFTAQWLSLDKFSVLEPDRKRFPKLTRDTRAQLRQEPIQFVQYLIQKNLPVRNLISSDFLLANEVVASYYDLADKSETGFQFAVIPHGRPELGGVLTQSAILAGLSDGRESNPVKRGAWLARRIIAEPPPPPPPNVPALKEDAKGLTLRQRLEQHRNVPACSQCHAKIDPWGVAFEEFDAGGRLKQQSVDARSTLPDKTNVAGAIDLKRYLEHDRLDQVAFSVLKHLTTYAAGRSLTYNEVSYLKQDSLKLKASGYRMKDMLRYVVNSKPFLEK